MAPPSPLAQILLYSAAATSALCVPGHTKMGTDLVFPSLATAGTRDKLARGKGAKEAKAGVGTDKGLLAAKIGWIEVNTGFVIMTVFCIKWANVGLTDVYDKALMGFYCGGQLYFGYLYLKARMYEPLIALWGVPALLGLSQLV